MALLDAKPAALRPVAGEPAVDRVVGDRAAGTPDGLREDLIGLLGERKVFHTLSDLVRYATDASPYRFVPQVVVIAETVEDADHDGREIDQPYELHLCRCGLSGNQPFCDGTIGRSTSTAPSPPDRIRRDVQMVLKSASR
jgi:CDGSH-type Zn-finger protein